MNTFLLLIIIHFVGDFIFQTSEMSMRKSISFRWLSYHAIVYSVVLWFGAEFFLPMFPNLEALILFVWVNFACHFVTDGITSRITAYMWKRHEANHTERVWGETWAHFFFVVIGFDQVIHYSCLFLTYQYFNK